MDLPRFDELDCHPNFEEHQAQTGRRVVTCGEAEEAWYSERTIVPNRRGRRAPYLLIGQTGSGRDITVVLLPTDLDGTWVAFTAWDTKPSDR